MRQMCMKNPRKKFASLTTDKWLLSAYNHPSPLAKFRQVERRLLDFVRDQFRLGTSLIGAGDDDGGDSPSASYSYEHGACVTVR